MSQSKNTKEKLIDSAIKVFAEKGFWQAKVSDIVRDAGVAQGTFYLYFKTKNDCFKYILSLLHKETIYILNEKFSHGANLYDILTFFIQRFYQYKKISKVFLFEAISSGNEFQELYFNFKKNFKNFFSNYYMKKLNDNNLVEIKTTILAGFLREIIEHDLIFENKNLNELNNKIKRAINILDGD